MRMKLKCDKCSRESIVQRVPLVVIWIYSRYGTLDTHIDYKYQRSATVSICTRCINTRVLLFLVISCAFIALTFSPLLWINSENVKSLLSGGLAFIAVAIGTLGSGFALVSILGTNFGLRSPAEPMAKKWLAAQVDTVEERGYRRIETRVWLEWQWENLRTTGRLTGGLRYFHCSSSCGAVQ